MIYLTIEDLARRGEEAAAEDVEKKGNAKIGSNALQVHGVQRRQIHTRQDGLKTRDIAIYLI